MTTGNGLKKDNAYLPLLLLLTVACTHGSGSGGLSGKRVNALGGLRQRVGVAEAIEFPKQLTTATADDYLPRLHPDGKSVVYVSDRRGNPDLFIRYLPGSGAIGDYPLTLHTARDTWPTISPSGEEVAFVSTRSDGRGDLFLLSLRKSDSIPEKIRERLYQRFGSLLSMSDDELAKRGEFGARLTKYLMKQAPVVQLTSGPDEDSEPAFSSTGDRVYFTRVTQHGPEIFSVSPIDGKMEAITNGGGSMAAPSPDGRYLAFVRSSANNRAGGAIWILDLSKREYRKVTSGPWDMHPAWGSQGRLFFSRYADDSDGDGKITLSDRSSIFSIQPLASTDLDPGFVRITPGDRFDLFPFASQNRVVFASSPGPGKGFMHLFALPETGFFSDKRGSKPYFVSPESFFGAATELTEGQPHLAALALETICGRWPDSLECLEALYRAGKIRRDLNDLEEAKGVWTFVSRSANARWARLSDIELERLRLREAIDRGVSEGEKKSLVMTAVRRLQTWADTAGRADLPDVGARARLEMGRTWLLIGEEGEAVRSFDEVITRHPDQTDEAAQAMLEKGALYRKFGDNQKLLQNDLDLLKKYPKAEPWASKAADDAVELLLAGQTTDMAKEARLREVTIQFSQVPILPALALNLLGDSARRRNDGTGAEALYRSVMNQFPKEELQVSRSEISLAELLAQRGDYEEALRLFRKAEGRVSKVRPWHKEARRRFVGGLLAKGRSEISSGDLKLAIRTFRDLISFDYSIPQAHRGLVFAYAANAEIDQVISIYKDEVSRYPDYYLPHYALGLAYTFVEPTAHGFDLAEPKLEEAIDLNGSAVFPHQTLGYVYEKREELLHQPDYMERAIDQYLVASSLSEPADDYQNFGDLKLNVGNGYFLLKDYGKAYESYAARKKLDLPFDPKAQELIFLERFARSAFHVNRFDESLARADEALAVLSKLPPGKGMSERELLSHEAEIRDGRALALQEFKKYEEASEEFARVADLNRKLNQPQNEAKAYRNLAINLFDAPPKSGFAEDERLAKARDRFDESLDLVASHGVKQTKEKKTGALLNVNMEVGLGDDTSEAAKGFSKKGEEELLYTFIGRLEKTRGRDDDALFAVDEKLKRLPKEGSVTEEKRPAFRLKRSILRNQRGVLLARLGRWSEAAAEFRSSFDEARAIPHETGAGLNALNLARLSNLSPSVVPATEAVSALETAEALLSKRTDKDSLKLRSQLALQALRHLDLGKVSLPMPENDPLSGWLKRIRFIASEIRKSTETDSELQADRIELDLVHLRWTRHTTVRDPSSKSSLVILEKEAGSVKRVDLVLQARLTGLWLTGPETLEELEANLTPILEWVPEQDLGAIEGAIGALAEPLEYWLSLAIAKGNAESVYRASEWLSRIRLAMVFPAPSLSRLGIVDPAELMETLGEPRSFVRRFEVKDKAWRLVVRAKGLEFEGDETTFREPTRDVYLSGGESCPKGALCAEVASAGHLFYALTSQGLFDRRWATHDPKGIAPTPEREVMAFQDRIAFQKTRHLADTLIAPSPLSPNLPPGAFSGRNWFSLTDPNLSRIERDIPLEDLLGSGIRTLYLPPSPSGASDNLRMALIAEWLARGGVATTLVTDKPPIPFTTRVGEFARQAGIPLYGALGYTAEERTEIAQQTLQEIVAKAAELYRAERWNESVRAFEEALDLSQIETAGVSREQLLDAAGTAAFRGDDLDRAVRFTNELVRLRRPAGGIPLAKALQFLGVLQSRQEKFPESIATLQEASTLFEKAGGKADVAESLSTLGIVHENAQLYSNALQYFDQSLEIHAKGKSARNIGEQWRRIGRIYYLRMNDYSRAEDAFRKAADAFRQDRNAALEDEAILEIGLVSERRAAFDAARSSYLGVLARAKTRKDLALSSKAAIYLANVAWFTGDYFEAFRRQREALDYATQAKDDRMILLCHSTVGLIYWTLNQHDKAILEQDAALKLSQSIVSPIDEASAYNNTGLVYRERAKDSKDLETSVEFFQRALTIDKKLGSKWGMAYDHRNLGISYTKLARFDLADTNLSESVKLSQAIGARINEAKALQSMGELYLAQNRAESAFPIFKNALKIAREAHLREVEWRALQGLSRVSTAGGNREGAFLYLKEAIDVVEGMSAEIKIEEFRNGFVLNKLSLYEDMVLLLLSEKPARSMEAWNYVERARSRNFLDLLGNRSIAPKEPADQKFLDLDRQNRKVLEQLENSLAGARDDQERGALVAKLREARRAREDLLIEIRARRPELSSFVAVDVLTLPQLRALLGRDTALVEYFLTAHELLAWVISDEKAEVVRVPVEKRALEQKVVEYSRKMQERLPLMKESEELYNLLWKPIETHVDGKKFVGISPHETLHYLSFASLFDGKRFLIDRLPIFYTPSASVFQFTLAKPSGAKGDVRVLAIGNPDLGNPALDLPFAEKEVGAIARNFPKIDILTRERATERWLVDNIGKYNVIHLASHGEFDPINPLFSAIKLAPTKDKPGDLRVEEIFSLKIDADLVTLSACQTGLAKVEGGGELVGLNRAFLFAGTHSILSSLWRVSDVSTAVLIKHFYRSYVEDSKAESLRKAQLLVKNYYPHPSYWAALSLTGDYR